MSSDFRLFEEDCLKWVRFVTTTTAAADETLNQLSSFIGNRLKMKCVEMSPHLFFKSFQTSAMELLSVALQAPRIAAHRPSLTAVIEVLSLFLLIESNDLNDSNHNDEENDSVSTSSLALNAQIDRENDELKGEARRYALHLLSKHLTHTYVIHDSNIIDLYIPQMALGQSLLEASNEDNNNNNNTSRAADEDFLVDARSFLLNVKQLYDNKQQEQFQALISETRYERLLKKPQNRTNFKRIIDALASGAQDASWSHVLHQIQEYFAVAAYQQ